MSVYNQALKLIQEYQKDHWLEVQIEDVEYNTIKTTLKVVMDDLGRIVNKYNTVKNASTLNVLKMKFRKAKDYYDIYKYQSIKSGITNGSTIKQPSN